MQNILWFKARNIGESLYDNSKCTIHWGQRFLNSSLRSHSSVGWLNILWILSLKSEIALMHFVIENYTRIYTPGAESLHSLLYGAFLLWSMPSWVWGTGAFIRISSGINLSFNKVHYSIAPYDKVSVDFLKRILFWKWHSQQVCVVALIKRFF